MEKGTYLGKMEMFAHSRMALVGYYSMMPMEGDLPEVFAAMHEVGCKTGLDAAGDGGGMKPLDRILPHVDVYVPSYSEAVHQTGEKEPERIVERFRDCGAPGMLGVKLGSKGALLSPKAGEFVRVEPVKPPGAVVDTTGAGDSFLGGLLTGMLRGMSVGDSGRLGAAAGACCVTGRGGTAGLRGFEATMQLAGLTNQV
jgi:sugar/nucleoside kinase (ribokinase family)